MRALNFISLLAAVGFVIGLYSCKDMGSEAAKPLLTATSLSVTLAPGGQTAVTISGGNPPYRVSEAPNAALATATLSGNVLAIQAVSANVSGTTRVKIVDTDPSGATDAPTHEEQEIEIEIRITATLVSFLSQVQPIFTASCVNAGCHPGGSAPFSLASGQSRANLVDVNMSQACGGKRVLAGDPNASGLIKKLEGTTCGNRMPQGGSALSASQIAVIRDWIAQGAQNN